MAENTEIQNQPNPHRIIEVPEMSEIEKARHKATEVIGQKPPRTAYDAERQKYDARGNLIDPVEIEKQQHQREILLGKKEPAKEDFESENFWKARQSGTNLPSSGQLPPTTRNDVQPVPVHVQVAAIIELPEDVQNIDENGAMFTITDAQFEKQIELWKTKGKTEDQEAGSNTGSGSEAGSNTGTESSETGSETGTPVKDQEAGSVEGKPVDSGETIGESKGEEITVQSVIDNIPISTETPLVDPEKVDSTTSTVQEIKTGETIQDAPESAPETSGRIPKKK